jgi:acetyltransferase-like isoleucine patch superfamily enzyme
MIGDILRKRKYDKGADRIGPDVPFTHWKLYFRKSMLSLCKKKFKYFSDSSAFRAGAYAIVCSKISIGKRVVISPGTMFFADPAENGAGITIEDDAMVGSGVHFYVGNHRFDDTKIPIIDQGHTESKPIVVKKGCWIGANVTILGGVEIGENAVVGAGSVVTKSVPSRVVAAGNPAKIIKSLE